MRCTHFGSDSARHAVPQSRLAHLEAGFAAHTLPLVPRFFALHSNIHRHCYSREPHPPVCWGLVNKAQWGQPCEHCNLLLMLVCTNLEFTGDGCSQSRLLLPPCLLRLAQVLFCCSRHGLAFVPGGLTLGAPPGWLP